MNSNSFKNNLPWLYWIIISIHFSIFPFTYGQSFQTTTFGTGTRASVDGTMSQASFNLPSGIKFDSSGNLIIVDQGHRIRKLFPNGSVITIAGDGTAASVDGQGTSSSLNEPTHLDIDNFGNIYIVELRSCSIRKIDYLTGYVSTVAGSGSCTTSVDGRGTSASFRNPWSVAVDSNKTLYVTESNAKLIRKILPDGTVSKFSGSGSTGFSDGPATSATFVCPLGIAINHKNELIVADGPDVTYSGVRMLTSDGTVKTISGGLTGYAIGTGAQSRLSFPLSPVIAENGDVFIADFSNLAILRINLSDPSYYTSVFVGTPPTGSPAGPFSSINLINPIGIAFDKFGSMFFSERDANRIRKITCTTACTPGTVAQTLNGCVCTPCPIGTYQPQSSQTYCLNCPNNTICTNTGMIKFLCSPGLQENGTSCTQCPSGTFKPGTTGSCLNCPTGATCNRTSFICNAGFGLNATGNGCVACGGSSYKNITSNDGCWPCPSNAICTATSFTCLPGFQSNGTACTECLSGTFKSGTSGSCVNCPTGATCNRTSFTCNAGFGLNATGNGCVACSVASFKSIASNDGCWPCPSNAACSPMAFACLPGFQSNGTACTECLSGTFKAGTTGSCINCPAGATCNRTSFTCNAGFGLNAMGNGCVACGGASYKSIPSNDGCWPCPSNAICSATSFTCSAGYVPSENGQACALAPNSSVVSQPTTSSSGKITVTSTPTTKNNQQVDSLNIWATWWKSYTTIMISIFVSVWLLLIAIGFVVGYYTHHASPKSTPYDNMTKTTTTKISELAGTGMYRPRSRQRTIRSSHAARTLRSRPSPQSQHGETSFSAP